MSEVLLQEVEKLAAQAKTKTIQLRKGETMIEIDQSHLKNFVSELVNRLNIKHLTTITGLDLDLNVGIIYHFWQEKDTLHVKTSVSKSESVAVSIVDLVPGAILYEMEIHDMFGVTFTGNPWMDKKLLLPDSWPSDLPPPLLKTVKPADIRKRLGLEAEKK
jgi:NADH:ubiquinone oxidoreductase subunit C